MTEKLVLLRKQSDNEERPEAFKHSTSPSLNEIESNGKFLASSLLQEHFCLEVFFLFLRQL